MVVVVPAVPWWGVVSAAAAPVLLVGGWTVAAGLQPRSVNAVATTISALAADGAADRWVMTLVLLAVGACDAVDHLAGRQDGRPQERARAVRPELVPGRTLGLLLRQPERVFRSGLDHTPVSRSVSLRCPNPAMRSDDRDRKYYKRTL